MTSVSVVLCCHNAAPRLDATLAHLAAVKVPAGQVWEVVLVDNASTDDTAGIAAQLWQRHAAPAPLRVVAEPRLGLNHARWTGIRAACGTLVSFVDDDNHVDPGWLDVLTAVFETHAHVGAVGAWAQAVADVPLPSWFERVQHLYACGPQADGPGPVAARRGYLYGAGLTIRRRALLDLDAGGFAPRLVGRTGRSLAGGEDSELCHALAAAGWTLWFEPALCLAHYMPPARLTLAYARRLSFEMGRAAVRLEATRPAARSPHRRLAALRRVRVFALGWYVLAWARAAARLPGRRQPLGGSYHRGRLAEALTWPRQR